MQAVLSPDEKAKQMAAIMASINTAAKADV
jgi:hypothetical protein